MKKAHIKIKRYLSSEWRLTGDIVLCVLSALMPCRLMSADRESVGLVLSGGGAKGIAHVGVIKALEDNDIPIDYVTGTSMGAIVGSFYSMGWTPEQMMRLFYIKGFRILEHRQD